MKTLTVSLLFAAVLFAQSEKKKLTFEVVSVKPHSGDPGRAIGSLTETRFTASNMPLRYLIARAYGDPNAGSFPFPDAEISGLPRWANADGYDVLAQAEAGFRPTREQTQEMLQSMLEDRFKLKIRRETKDRPIYALVVDKGGVKMKLSDDKTPFNPLAAPPPGTPLGSVQLRAPKQTTAWLASVLTQGAGRKVVDKTGLTGLYDIDLKFTPDQRLPPGTEIDTNLPSMFTALQEQLGLRLVSDTGPVDTFVVESVDRPSEN